MMKYAKTDWRLQLAMIIVSASTLLCIAINFGKLALL